MTSITVCIGITILLLFGLVVFFGLNWLAALVLKQIEPPQIHWPDFRAKQKRKQEWSVTIGDDGEIIERTKN